MATSVTPDAISTILANPSPGSSSEVPEIVVQVVDLKLVGNGKYMFVASDGKMKLNTMVQRMLNSKFSSNEVQNLGLIRVLNYTVSELSTNNQKKCVMILQECEVVSPALDAEYKADVHMEEAGIVLKPKDDVQNADSGIALKKPKQEIVSKSATQIVLEQNRNMAPAARMGISRRIYPLLSLNPYQGIWTIKVRVTSMGNMRTYKNARGEGCVFNVELTDDDGTQIQATMFNEAAKKFFDKFALGKVYYISKGTLKVANKQFSTVKNDYEMTLNENSEVEEVTSEAAFVPETKFNFVPIDELGPYVNGKELVDVIGVVQSVSPTMSIRRKINNETVPKRDITIADETKKTVVVSLWNDLATQVGQDLLDKADEFPVVAIKNLRVGDYQGVSLSCVSKSVIKVDPESPEAKKLKSWYLSEGKETSLASIGAGMSPGTKGGSWSMFTDRAFLSDIVSNPSLGEEKPVFYSIKAYVSLIKHDQPMWYTACKTCNKKVMDGFGSNGYYCNTCEKDAEFSLRYIMNLKVSDASGEAWLSVFNEQAETLLGCTADELNQLRSEDDGAYQMKLKEATWVPHLFRVSVTQNEFKGEKRQRIAVRVVAPVDYAAESKFLMEEVSKMKI